jgi:hypothetical protein
MPRGYDRALYILPFDHRGSFQAKMFGWKSRGADSRDQSPRSCRMHYSRPRRGERKVRQWLGVAAEVPGFIGFAVGRTVFWDPLVAWRSKKATREQTVALIAKRYREFVDLFERATTRLPSALSERTRSEHRPSKEA